MHVSLQYMSFLQLEMTFLVVCTVYKMARVAKISDFILYETQTLRRRPGCKFAQNIRIISAFNIGFAESIKARRAARKIQI